MPKTTIPEPRSLAWPTDVPRPLSAPPLTDAPSDGPKVIRWIEANCVYGEGDAWGEPVRLQTFQKLFLCWLYEKRPDGRYRYQLATQRSPVIPVAASSYDQAEIVFGDLRSTVTESPTLSEVMVAFEGEVQVKGGPGRAFKVAAVAGTNDGLRPSTFVADELHEWAQGNRERVHLVISNGTAKRDGSLTLNVTTPGWDLETLAGRLHTYGLGVNSGEITDDEFLFVWWGCPAERYNLSDEKELLAAIRDANPAAGSFLNIHDVASRYHQIPLHEFARYHLGIWTRTAKAWLPPGVWEACADPSAVIADGADVILGFDGSFAEDSTALVVATCGEHPHLDVVGCWERPARASDDWTVPIADVEETIRQACRRYSVAEIVIDPYGYRRSFQVLEDEGLPVVDYPQTSQRMTPATQKFYELVANRALTHSGDRRLARHLANAMLKVDSRGQRIVKEHKTSTRKIDLAVAAVMAVDRATVVAPTYNLLDSVL
jgi:phage terminase large subunit-like protein